MITEASVTGSVGNTLGELMRAVRGELIGARGAAALSDSSPEGRSP